MTPTAYTTARDGDVDVALHSQCAPRSRDSSVKTDSRPRTGLEYVVYRRTTQVPLSEWLPEPETVTSRPVIYPNATDQLTQDRIAEVTADGRRSRGLAPRENTVELSEGGNVTLTSSVLHALPRS